MKHFTLILFCCYVIFEMQCQVMSLKCRSGNQQSDEQFQKIMQTCRKRFLGYGRDNDRNSNGRETDSQESSDSDEDDQTMFDRKFFNSNGNQNNKYDRQSSVNIRYDYSNSSPSSRNMTHQSSNRNWGNRSYLSNSMSSINNKMNSKDYQKNIKINNVDSSGYTDNYSSRYNKYNKNNVNYNDNNYNNNDDNYNHNGNHEQAVDQRGFPEKSSVIGIMTQNIQDFELRDFVEESVIECYRYLNNNGRQEKCQYSQTLLSCLAEKGSEKCEDWDDK